MSNTQNIHCRLCADLKSYDELVDLEAEKEKKIRVLERLSRLNIRVTSLHATEDVLPKTVCERCMELLFKAYNFVLDVETAQEALKVHLLVQNIKNNLDSSGLRDESKYGSRDIKIERVYTQTECSTEYDSESGLNISERQLQNDEALCSTDLSLQNIPEVGPNRLNFNIKLEESNEIELQTDSGQIPSGDYYESDLETDNEFQVDTEVATTEVELKNGLEEDLDNNDFKKDFQVTVTGYQMEITSKLRLNNCGIDIESNENSITDNDELLIDLDPVNIDDSQKQNISNVNNEKISLKSDNTHIQTRKRKLDDTEDLFDLKTEQIRNLNVAKNALQCSKEDLSDNIVMNNPIVVLNKISIHNGHKHTLIISPLTKNNNKNNFDSKKQQIIDLTMSSHEKESVNSVQISTNEIKRPPESKKKTYKTLTQSEFSWKQYSWQCGDCKRYFDRINKLVTHSKNIHNSCGNYQCTDCEFRSSVLDIFVSHVTMHREYLSQSCFKCHRSFESPHLVQKHYDSYMKSDHLCIGCNETFETKHKLAKHEEMYRKQNSISSSQASLKEFEKNVQLGKAAPSKEVDNNVQMEKTMSLKEAENNVQMKKAAPLKEVENLQMEISMFLKEGENNGAMQMEMKGLDEKQYICDYCGKMFMYKHFLIYHIEMQHKF